MKELDILNLSIKDYFTKPILRILIYPLLGSIIVLYISFFTVAHIGLDSLENMQAEINQQETIVQNDVVGETMASETYTGSEILDFLLKHTITSWIVSFLVYAIGLFAIGYISIFISIIIIGFLTPRILSIIHKRHYSHIKVQSYGSIFDGFIKLFKTLLITILIFLILLPLYFIPIINIIAINIPIFYFFHKMLHYDVSSTILSYNDFIKIYFNKKFMMRGRTLLLYVVSLVPFVAFFISVFYIIYLGHAYFSQMEDEKLLKNN